MRANNKLDMKSDQCYPPPSQFLNGFKHISKVVLEESVWGGTRPPQYPPWLGHCMRPVRKSQNFQFIPLAKQFSFLHDFC
jgi:hypothetical protein